MSARDAAPAELEQLRGALEAAIARSSLRAVSTAVGMSPTGLSKFLDGGRPYARTLERLRRWYARRTGGQSRRADEIADDLRRYVATLPDPDRGVANLLDAIERSYAAAGLAVPDWVGDVRRTLRG